jgi:hypothetical protein
MAGWIPCPLEDCPYDKQQDCHDCVVRFFIREAERIHKG